MNLLYLLSNFGYHASARQVALLAPELARAGDSVHVAGLGGDGPLSASLRSAGIPAHALGTGRRFDPACGWRLRQLVAELRPDVVHAWRLPALRAAGILHWFTRRMFRMVVSEPRRGGHLTTPDRWLLRRADAVHPGDPAEAEGLRRLGVPPDCVHVIPPPVAIPPSDTPPPDLPVPPEARVVLCVGSLTPAHGFRDAIWAADILKYVVPDLHVVIVGDGSQRARLGQFAQQVNLGRGEECVHLLPARPDAAALLPRADVVWVPSRSECGRQVLLEALAAGRPVVASALPGLAALVSDGVTGLLAPPGDPPALARQTRRLFDDAELAARLGAAARQAAAGHAPARVAPAYRGLYTVCGSAASE